MWRVANVAQSVSSAAGSPPADQPQALRCADIVAGLHAVGVTAGVNLEVHSSLKSLGVVAGGAATVIDALQEAVGPEGTLVLPSFNHGAAYDGSSTGYDPAETPTTNGAIPDTFWRRPGVLRSVNPTHAFAAWGRQAERYTADHHRTLTMGADSPLGRMLQVPPAVDSYYAYSIRQSASQPACARHWHSGFCVRFP
jgi:aminoglycoside 3-N-acetyltransferase